MRILDMETFILLARTRHFGRAAQELNTTQPAISNRLAAIEEELGCRLVHRGDRGFALTPEGQQALATFQAVIQGIGRLKSGLGSPQARSRDLIRIGAIDAISGTWMPQLIEQLHEAAPELRVELTVESTRLLVQGMHKGEFDLIFAIDPVIDDRFRSFVSCVLQMIWAGSARIIDPAQRYTVDELGRMPLITFPKGTPPYRMIAPYFHDEQVLAAMLTSSNSLFAMINLLIDGLGVGAIPAVTIHRELKAGLLHPLQVTKSLPPLPIIASYQTTSDTELVRLVVEQSRRSAAGYCAGVAPDVAWTPR